MKVLEFLKKSQLAPIGGPLGYTYALYNKDKENNGVLCFLEGTPNANKGPIQRHRNGIISVLTKYLSFLKMVLIGSRDDVIENNEYDIIHFHNTFDLYRYRKSLKKFKGVSLLTSHSPTLASNELFSSASLIEKILFWPVFLLLRFADKRAFRIPNYIVFPCEFAEEPYAHAWKGFKSFKDKNSWRIKYLTTGTYRRIPLVSKKDIRERYGIPSSSKVVCFVGRHNKIKGYDILKRIAEKMLAEDEDLYFLIVGKEKPLKRLNNSRWIEVGWTNDPHSFISAADVFVLPNRETYFDLVFLEALSLGQLVVASKTGGNKFFTSFDQKGILEFESLDEAVNQLKHFLNLSSEEQNALRKKNVELFDNYFSDSVFYKNYVNLLRSLLSDEKN